MGESCTCAHLWAKDNGALNFTMAEAPFQMITAGKGAETGRYSPLLETWTSGSLSMHYWCLSSYFVPYCVHCSVITSPQPKKDSHQPLSCCLSLRLAVLGRREQLRLSLDPSFQDQFKSHLDPDHTEPMTSRNDCDSWQEPTVSCEAHPLLPLGFRSCRPPPP